MSIDLPATEREIVWPTHEQAEKTLAEFTAAVRRHYGERLRGMYLFGSRARGDYKPQSDADVAVVLDDGDWVPWMERRVLNQLAYDASLESGLPIQPWPFTITDWNAERQGTSKLIGNARRDAVSIG